MVLPLGRALQHAIAVYSTGAGETTGANVILPMCALEAHRATQNLVASAKGDWRDATWPGAWARTDEIDDE